MSDLDVSAIITALSDDYANNLITFSEYRTQRRIIILQLEKELNKVSFDDETINKTRHKNEENIKDKKQVLETVAGDIFPERFS